MSGYDLGKVVIFVSFVVFVPERTPWPVSVESGALNGLPLPLHLLQRRIVHRSALGVE